MKREIPFMCTANKDRSLTAEEFLRNKDGFEVYSAGTWLHARRKITEELIERANIILTMEEHHRQEILSLKPDAEEMILVLEIPDIYPRHSPELEEILKSKLSKHLNMKW